MKRLTSILAVILSFVFWLGGDNSAFAQSFSAKSARGVISVYNTPEQQEHKKEIFKKEHYQISIPFQLPEGINIPDTKEDFDNKLLTLGVDKLGDGSVTEAWFDFQNVKADTVGNELFIANAPLGQRLYSVVAGKALQQCPLEIEDTQIAFFTDKDKAVEKANKLADDNYFVYVSPEPKFRKNVIDDLYVAYSEHSKERACFAVDGATKKITLDLKDIYNLLPERLQQPARQHPFVFYPKDDFLYVVNARSSGNPVTAYKNN